MPTHRENRKARDIQVVLIAILGIAVVTILYAFSNGICGNDFWWHIKVGEWICKNGVVPTTDIFSWYGTSHEIPWTAHEWLADVILYILHSSFGAIGIYVLSLAAAFAMLGLLWWEAKTYIENNILIGGLFFALFAVTTSMFFYGRPHLFSFFLLYFELKALFRFFNNQQSKGIYFIPLIACLWSNIHGGSSSLAYILCGVFLIVSLLDIRIGRIRSIRLEKTAVIKLLIVTICTIAAILVNPIGLEVLTYPYKSLGDQLMMSVISEWRAPDAKNTGELILFFLPIVIMLIGFFSEEKHIRLIDLGVMGVFVFLFLRSVRFIMLWYIAAAFCAFRYIPMCKTKPMDKKSERILVVFALAVFLIVAGLGASNVVKTAQNNELISVTMSDAAVAAVKEDAPERLFNDYNLGEALIYNDIPVFFDARADLYAHDSIMADGVSLMLLEQANIEAGICYVEVDALIGKYGFDAILIMKDRALYSYMIADSEKFVCVYEDETVGYFRIVE